MILLDGKLIWTATDLGIAASCEYTLLRTADYRLGRAEKIETDQDALDTLSAALGERHEQRLLAQYEKAGEVVKLERAPYPNTLESLTTLDDASLAGLSRKASVVYQAGFFDGDFHGYADFLESSPEGWIVCDAKLARSARPKALLQLGAYAEQLLRMNVPLAPTVSLLLGSGERVDFRTDDVLPAFRERRARLRALLDAHHTGNSPVAWGDDRYGACGRCDECIAAAEAAHDIWRVAGMNATQRRKLRAAGVNTIGELAAANTGPNGMAPATFQKLKTQARLQWTRLQGGPDAPVTFELTPTGADILALLPAPSPGDLFFDFEGDPLYDEGDPSRSGLEYLWGVMDVNERYEFTPRWAHSWHEERASFEAFVDFVTARRKQFPDLHIFHYAPYETSALKRMIQHYQTRMDELDTLLRDEVFVDLYATVKGSIFVASPSYSIKKLEPLYMGNELRNTDGVTTGGDSILVYQQFRENRHSKNKAEAAAAQKCLDDLEDYNRYDCLSTLRLRDWLMQRARDAGVIDRIRPRTTRQKDDEEDSLDDKADLKADTNLRRRALTEALLARAGDEDTARNPEQQAYAMLASALNYYRLERNVYWWEHFTRLANPIEEWADTRDVFVVESARIEQDWTPPGTPRAKNHKRIIELTGDWAPGSHAVTSAFAIYAPPLPAHVTAPEGAFFGATGAGDIDWDPDHPRTVRLTQSRAPDALFHEMPIALTPGKPPKTDTLEANVEGFGRFATQQEDGSTVLPDRAIFDLLLRRTPRSRMSQLPRSDKPIADIVAALLGMDDSYLAIQGPPGTGKTWTAARVIRALVETHHWRIGVVAQSHTTVENLLRGLTEAGLDAALVGKSVAKSQPVTWTELADKATARTLFVATHSSTGCVLGGTTWTFANPDLLMNVTLDLLVIDEAGQFSLVNTMAASLSARRLLLLGDPQQLPQVSQAKHTNSVDASALGWLMHTDEEHPHATLPPEFGYFLADSYRMHPVLCEKVSALSYARRLHSAADASERLLEGVAPGLVVVNVDHTGNRTESVEEAAAVVEQVRSLLGKLWRESKNAKPRPLECHDFLVVAPYNAQVACIRDALNAAGLHTVRVGTVDKFQGQQAPIALVSMTASSSGDVPRGMGFILNRNRVNVAISRAMWCAILIRSPQLTSYMPSTTDELLELGAFIGLCAGP